MKRRAIFGLIGLTAKAERPLAGGFVNESATMGHRLRDRARFARPAPVEAKKIVVVGGGIAGLSAAWYLRKRGFHDFVVLDAEPEAGGNSRFGENDVTPYPWAAHYVPVPNKSSRHMRELFTELGLLDAQGKADERWLCHSPRERLFINGRWYPGIDPERHGTRADRRAFDRFEERVAEFHDTGRFTVPMADGYRPGPLDRVSMFDWMRANGLADSPALDWEIDYSCRDDFGGGMRDVSAWAGIQYYASREHEEDVPFTFPEGNGWILRRLLAGLRGFVLPNSLVHAIQRDGTRWRVEAEQRAYRADAVVFAAPSFIAPYVVEGMKPLTWTYSPWLTANLTVENAPDLGETAWDNVIYDSRALGYVVATHQSLKTHHARSVWTYYWALPGDARAQRAWLLALDWKTAAETILRDLGRAHPKIRDHVSRLDVMRMGHAMRRPVPGGFGSAMTPDGIYLANADLSGFSVFEEAQDRGIKGAQQALKRVS